MRNAEFIGFAKINGKDVVVFKQHDAVRVTDGFHDRELNDKERGRLRLNDSSVRPDKLIKKLRGTRPWHPVLKAINNASNSSFI